MKVINSTTYRSEGRGINHTDNRVRITIDCSVNEFNRYFRDKNLRKIKVIDTAIEACKAIDAFQSKCMTGYPIVFASNGKKIDHTALNHAYDLAYKVLHQLDDNNDY